MSLNTFDRAKIRQEFQPAAGRPACRSCQHASTRGLITGVQCMKGGFYATAYSICKLYEPVAPVKGAAA